MHEAGDPIVERIRHDRQDELVQLATILRGRFVAFDGPDGTGKSSQVKRLATLLRSVGGDVVLVRDPGATRIGETIRDLVLNRSFEEMRLETEMLLFMASRAQLIKEEILPAIHTGHIVLADRFLASTYAYQGITKRLAAKYKGIDGLRMDLIRRTASVVLGQDFPTFTTFIFLADVGVTMKRMQGSEIQRHGARVMHGTSQEQFFLFGDRFEHVVGQFQRKVGDMYRFLIEQHHQQYRKIDANGDEESVFDNLLGEMFRVFFVKTDQSARKQPRTLRAKPSAEHTSI